MKPIYALLAATTAACSLACDDAARPSGPGRITSDVVSAASPVTTEERCRSITPQQADRYGIERAEWKTSDPPIPFAHCKVLFSLSKSGAEYTGNGSLVDFNANIPGTGISRIAECVPKIPTTQVILYPGSSQDQTGLLGRNAFRLIGSPANECVPVSTIYYPSSEILAAIGEQEAQYAPPSSGRDFLIATHAMSHLAHDLVREVFQAPNGVPDGLVGCAGVSYGATLGFLAEAERHGSACDGILLSSASNGWIPALELWRSICATDGKIPLTGQDAAWCEVPGFASAEVRGFANGYGLFDPAFRAQVLEALEDPARGEPAAQQLLAAYDLTGRPKAVQREAAGLTPTGDLQTKVLMVVGTHDDGAWAMLALRYAERVALHQKGTAFRLYLANGLGHEQVVNFSTAAASQLLLRWMAGEEPGDLVFTVPSAGTMTVLNSTQAGFANDPCGYFDFTVQSTVCRDSRLFP